MSRADVDLRREIAAMAARLIADGGLDYGNAKTRAAQASCGGRAPRAVIPNNDEIDAALREHLELFDEHHDERVSTLRSTALALMEQLEEFRPLATGAVWKGLAAEHAPIHLQLFADNAKEVEYWLLNRQIDFDVSTIEHFRGRCEVPALTLYWQDQPVLLSLYDADDLRGALRAARGDDAPRGNRRALELRSAQQR
ncbi:MAG: hypothetical protein KJZ83_20610 [Burkholderiaceae bacterium]|nr:hypothetical protein [Burkholderiaceae bacterium]